MAKEAPGGGSGLVAMLREGDVRAFLGRHSDVGLAAMVVAIVAMMIVPLPTVLLDLLITLNIAIAVTLLLIAIYVGEALKIATFPTLLLLTTLFRLAIEVSATRLILLKADAGEVIHAFGNFVVSGNLVVGAVIFLILTMIQFIVIAKGSERVAEVGARFTLDAMPGKQMSIDAELRAGHIDNNEARRRRAMLARESQFFGSMDGAMKFVKGDAIAGIVILCVNIIGGLVIGVVQRGMDVGAAARTYTILTIGEGLVSQIPALIISTAAGVIVTRVSSEEEGSHLGKDIGGQILAQPKALAVAAALLGLFAIVPGLPAVPFLLLATLLGLVAQRLMRPHKLEAAPALVEGASADKAASAAPTREALPAPVLVPLALDLSPRLCEWLSGKDDAQGTQAGLERFTRELVPTLRAQYFAETGLPLPGLKVRANVASLPEWGYSIRLQEVPTADGEMQPGCVLALADPDAIASLGLDGTVAQHPDGSPAVWVKEAAAPACGLAGIGTLQAGEVVTAHLLTVLRRHGHQLLGIQESQALLESLEKSHPALVREVVPKLLSPVLLTDVLKRLAEEGISVRGLREILEALAEWGKVSKDPVELTEHVRAALRRQITYRYAGRGKLGVYLLDPMIEETVREAIHRTESGTYLALEPALSRDIVKSAVRVLGGRAGARAIILTNQDIRRFVRRLIEADLPEVAVLSFQELGPDTQLQPLGRIGVGA